MKVLYLASCTPEVESLALEVEITGIQRRLRTDSAHAVQFIFLPDVKLEDVPLEITRHKPDVLHISVHGERSGLWFATADGRMLPLSADQLADFLPRDHLPKLVFLNACDSHLLARRLAKLDVLAIGAKAPITNRAAIAAATLLYDRLLNGETPAATFTAVAALVSAYEEGRSRLVFYGAERPSAHRPLLVLPRLVAKLTDQGHALRNKTARFHIGFTGCPPSTTQICFFTDDSSFIVPDEDGDVDLEADLCDVVRDVVRGGEIWTIAPWEIDGDCRVAGCGITGDGVTFSASGLVSDLLEAYAASTPAPAAYLDTLPQVLDHLRTHVGAGLVDWAAPEPRRRRTTASEPDAGQP